MLKIQNKTQYVEFSKFGRQIRNFMALKSCLLILTISARARFLKTLSASATRAQFCWKCAQNDLFLLAKLRAYQCIVYISKLPKNPLIMFETIDFIIRYFFFYLGKISVSGIFLKNIWPHSERITFFAELERNIATANWQWARAQKKLYASNYVCILHIFPPFIKTTAYNAIV